MKNKIFFGVVSGLLLLGTGCTYVQDAGTDVSYRQPSESASKEVVLARDTEYGFEFVVSPQCADDIKIKGKKVGVKPVLVLYREDVKSSSYYPFNREYQVMRASDYNAISNDEMPGKPRINLSLSNGEYLLVSRDPQDGYAPSDPEAPAFVKNNCALNIRAVAN